MSITYKDILPIRLIIFVITVLCMQYESWYSDNKVVYCITQHYYYIHIPIFHKHINLPNGSSFKHGGAVGLLDGRFDNLYTTLKARCIRTILDIFILMHILYAIMAACQHERSRYIQISH